MEGNIDLKDVEIQALKDLVEIAVNLKRSGLLGMLKSLLEDYEAALIGLQADPSLLRLGIFIGALFEASRKLEGEKIAALKMNTEDATYCLFDSLASTVPSKAEPKGLWGLMGALRDPDVQKGLGYIIALAKNLGACINKKLK